MSEELAYVADVQRERERGFWAWEKREGREEGGREGNSLARVPATKFPSSFLLNACHQARSNSRCPF